MSSPKHAALLENTKSLAQVMISGYDALFLAGGQSPMYTFIDDAKLHQKERGHSCPQRAGRLESPPSLML